MPQLVSNCLFLTYQLVLKLYEVNRAQLGLEISGPSSDKKAQLSLTNPRDAKACQKLLQFDVLTTLSLIILA